VISNFNAWQGLRLDNNKIGDSEGAARLWRDLHPGNEDRNSLALVISDGFDSHLNCSRVEFQGMKWAWSQGTCGLRAGDYRRHLRLSS